ncbi:alpha/beta fold hydrolase [Streptomyces sp. Li-HN-5-11]|uniref:alpha/beta fold hydrolase n=1 Tax=Streptomyces sp. Li-HN-5-11 TaxID=3075432 RepID=UPI0028A79CD9|nr:alpha/beta fold hydrolase [Streptomyces sp. Li-HN-5-11]WNM30825.1 alpha/beta fold hydrolase [Streptomyces sp. Li-HN-5-11]
MTAVVFIHGTGVREPGFSALAGRVSAGLGALRDGLRIVPYYWGGAHGATLAAGGASLPPEAGASRGLAESPAPDGDDGTAAAWAALYTDPYAELALAAAGARSAGERPPGHVPPEQQLQARLAALAAGGDAPAAELGPGLARAAGDLARHPLLGRAADALDAGDLATLAARSLTARLVADLLDADSPLVPDGDTRDAVTARLAGTLGATPGGTERGLRSLLLRTAGSAASRAVVRRRRALTQAAHPAAGDILRYLSRGAAVRDDLRALVAGLQPPVVLVGHSLGGIIALDTLVSAPLPAVRLLVTAGSQGPFLYESGSLPSLEHPAPLPPHVPAWLNLYDPRDLLGYAGAGLFPGRVTDVAVDSRQPFPAAHSAYWTNPAVYRHIVERLP